MAAEGGAGEETAAAEGAAGAAATATAGGQEEVAPTPSGDLPHPPSDQRESLKASRSTEAFRSNKAAPAATAAPAAPAAGRAAPQQQQQQAEKEDEEDSADIFLDFDRPKKLRNFELQACAQLPGVGPLREALAALPRAVRPATAMGGAHPATPGPAAAVSGLTPLETACQAGRLDNVRLLLKEAREEAGSAFAAAPACPSRAMSLAVDSGCGDVVRLLLRSRVAANAAEPGGRPPLLAAIRDMRTEIVEALCAHPETDLDAQDARGSTALHEAVQRRSVGTVQVLLERKANPSLLDERGWTPLQHAAHTGDLAAMRLLLSAGAPVDGPGPAAAETEQAGRGPYPAAAPAQNAALEQAYSGARPPAAGWAPLHLLLAGGDEEAVAQLLQWAADPCRRGGPDGMNPLMLAISFGHSSVAQRLLALGAVARSLDEQDLRGRCALHFAVMTPTASIAIVQILLEVHASPSLRNENGLTPIDVARNAGISEQNQVIKRLQVEEAVRLVMQRSKCRTQKKYEESEMIRNDLRLRGVTLDIQTERWTLPDGTWGYLAAERGRAQAQGGPGCLSASGPV